MTRWDEDALEEACARGDEAALDEAFRLLDEPHAYTRARASEMLSLAPEQQLSERLLARFRNEFPSPLVWRVVALFANEHGRPPGGDVMRHALMRASESAPTTLDADSTYYVIAALSEARVDGVTGQVERWLSHGDEEVALAAASLVARFRRLSTEELSRLARFTSAMRFDAMMLRVEQGDKAAIPDLARAISEAGPLAFEALDTLERHGGNEALAPLRETWSRRFGVGHIAARTAASAVVLGDTAALARLRELARSWRRATRAVALAELARVGTNEDFERVAERARKGGPEAAHVVAEIWRRGDGRATALVASSLVHPDPDVRVAAAESAGRLPGALELGPPLTRCLDDHSPAVVAAARAAIAQRMTTQPESKRTRDQRNESRT